MRINNNKIIKMFESLGDKTQINKFLNYKFDDDNAFSLIPFTLEDLGLVNSTEAGFQKNNIKIDSFTSYAKVITGLSSMLAKWDNAYKVYQKEPEDTFLTKEFKVGRTIKATSTTLQTGSNLIRSPIDDNFKQIEIEENITIQINEQLSAEDIFKVFIIPEKNKWRWLYIPAGGITEYFDKDNEFVYADIQLSSLNSLYATSGGAIEQFIQKSAPGDGYAWPKIDKETNKIILDDVRAWDIPITSAQREYSGVASFGTVFYYGRPTIQETDDNGIIKNVFNPKIEASRLLLPYGMETPIISPINTKPSAETDYFIGNGEPTLQQGYKDWREQWGQAYSLEIRKVYQGILKLPIIAELEKTNPIFNGSRQFTLWDTQFKINYSNKKFDCSTNKLTGGKPIILNGELTIPQILAHNSFILNHLTTLPMNAETNTTWKLSDVPIIGGFLNTLTLGIPIGWTDNNVRVKMGDVPLLIPVNVVLYGNEIIANTENSWIPFDLFKQNKANIIEDSGIAGMGSSIKFSLTDRFEKDGKIYNTIQLGQKQADGTILEWDGNCKSYKKDDKTPGYVIDKLVDKSISMTDCRTTFFSYGYEIFQITNTTKSKFTGEIRDWTNDISFSKWESEQGLVSFPEIIQMPKPETTEPVLIEIPFPRKIFIGFNEQNTGLDFSDWRNWLIREDGQGKYSTKSSIDFKEMVLDNWNFNYTNYAPNIVQLALAYEEIIFEYILDNKETIQIRFKIQELTTSIKNIRLGNWNPEAPENYWIGKINYLVYYSRGNQQLEFYIDANTQAGIINFKIEAVANFIIGRTPEFIYTINGATEPVLSSSRKNGQNYNFTFNNAFIVPKK